MAPFRSLNRRGGSLPLPPLVSVDSRGFQRPKGRSCHWQAGRFAPLRKPLGQGQKITACFSAGKRKRNDEASRFLATLSLTKSRQYFPLCLWRSKPIFYRSHLPNRLSWRRRGGRHSLALKRMPPPHIFYLFISIPPLRRRWFFRGPAGRTCPPRPYFSRRG